MLKVSGGGSGEHPFEDAESIAGLAVVQLDETDDVNLLKHPLGLYGEEFRVSGAHSNTVEAAQRLA